MTRERQFQRQTGQRQVERKQKQHLQRTKDAQQQEVVSQTLAKLQKMSATSD
jgi:hypothetical protein